MDNLKTQATLGKRHRTQINRAKTQHGSKRQDRRIQCLFLVSGLSSLSDIVSVLSSLSDIVSVVSL
jgi:hypothetical protein